MILFDIAADLYGPPSNEGEDSNAFQARPVVSAVFDQVEPLQAQLTSIATFREPMQRLGELAKVFDELRKFAIQVSDLARVLKSMHNFRTAFVRSRTSLLPWRLSMRNSTGFALRSPNI